MKRDNEFAARMSSELLTGMWLQRFLVCIFAYQALTILGYIQPRMVIWNPLADLVLLPTFLSALAWFLSWATNFALVRLMFAKMPAQLLIALFVLATIGMLVAPQYLAQAMGILSWEPKNIIIAGALTCTATAPFNVLVDAMRVTFWPQRMESEDL